MSKNLEKEREKLKEHEDAPERCAKEIEEGKAKIIILEVLYKQIAWWHWIVIVLNRKGKLKQKKVSQKSCQVNSLSVCV